jgi:small-conductance mechanosensitive channel
MAIEKEQIVAQLAEVKTLIASWATSSEFYAQVAAIGCAIALAVFVSVLLKRRVPWLNMTPQPGPLYRIRQFVYRLGEVLFPLFVIFFLGVTVSVSVSIWDQAWLIRLSQSLAVVFLLYTVVSRFVTQQAVKLLLIWLGTPVALLQMFGWLDDVTAYLDSISLTAGDIHLSLFALIRTLIFGALLFWLGRLSNTAGKQAIRNQQSLDAGTREVFAKLFEIALFAIFFLLLLQVMGINLTTLAVFGGALGVGLGFGLQQIASNFVSGIIILLDRSITIGDFVELEDGRSGVLRELNMRFGILESYDGKDIMVPNEKFITSSYTNWTHKNKRQRYPLEFQVAYSTDLDKLFDNIRAICVAHPKVLSGEHIPIEERPDAEIAGFGESGIDILVEFWIEGVDDGVNRVGADLLHAIWKSIQENGMQIPFPQREVRIVKDDFPSPGAPS